MVSTTLVVGEKPEFLIRCCRNPSVYLPLMIASWASFNCFFKGSFFSKSWNIVIRALASSGVLSASPTNQRTSIYLYLISYWHYFIFFLSKRQIIYLFYPLLFMLSIRYSLNLTLLWLTADCMDFSLAFMTALPLLSSRNTISRRRHSESQSNMI